MPAEHLTDVERESISLLIVCDSIDGFVNHAHIMHPARGGSPTFQTQESQELFVVRLADFLEPVKDSMTGVTGSCLDLVGFAVEHRSLEFDASVERLSDALRALTDWLAERTTFKVWMPSIDLDADIEIPRGDLVYICGNSAKHNLARLSGVSNRLKANLAANNYLVSLSDTWIALEEFYAQARDDFLAYSCPVLSEILTNLRWEVHEYLLPEFQRSFTRDHADRRRYAYRYPDGLVDPFAQWCYWRLMNLVRSTPPFARFSVDPIFRLRYSGVPKSGAIEASGLEE